MIISENIRIPGAYAGFDSQGAVSGLSLQPYQTLLVGQRLTGSVPANTLKRIVSAAQAGEFFGRGSQLHRMAEAYFANNRLTETWAVALDDAAGAAKASGTITVNGTASAAGTMFVYVAGERVTVGALTGDTAAEIATAIHAAINANSALPVTAESSGAAVTVTAKNAGAAGNDLDLRLNYFVGEEFPLSVSATVNAMDGGTNNPDLNQLWPSLGDEWFNVIACPYSDPSNLSSLHSELADRWGPERGIEGVGIVGASGTFGELVTLGETLNSPHIAVMGADSSPSAPYQWAAAMAGQVAASASNDPARPFQSLPLNGVLPPDAGNRFLYQQRNQLLHNGIGTYRVQRGGVVSIERAITSYQETPSGTPDTAFLDLNTPLSLGFLRWDAVNAIEGTYGRHKLAQDGNYGAGQPVVTPRLARAHIISRASLWNEFGIIEDLEDFKRTLDVQISSSEATRLEYSMSPNLVNGFRVAALDIGFKL